METFKQYLEVEAPSDIPQDDSGPSPEAAADIDAMLGGGGMPPGMDGMGGMGDMMGGMGGMGGGTPGMGGMEPGAPQGGNKATPKIDPLDVWDLLAKALKIKKSSKAEKPLSSPPQFDPMSQEPDLDDGPSTNDQSVELPSLDDLDSQMPQ